MKIFQILLKSAIPETWQKVAFIFYIIKIDTILKTRSSRKKSWFSA